MPKHPVPDDFTPQTATLSLNQTTAVAGDGGYSQVGTIEGGIQIESNKTITFGVHNRPRQHSEAGARLCLWRCRAAT
jgi:hypothetical protein